MTEEELLQVPGGHLVARGLRDLARGSESVESLLVEVAASRLRAAGLRVPPVAPHVEAAELRLYRRIGASHPDPYTRYNSLLRELDSCARALEGRAFAKTA